MSTTYILKQDQIDNYYDFVIKDVNSIEEAKLKIGILGLEELELEEAKRKANVGDCLLFEYEDKMLPFQIVHKYQDGKCVMSSYYVTDSHIFDEKTNKWKDSEMRRYMNDDIAKKFNTEILSRIQEKEVHTEDYVTEDKFWLFSHEEIGYVDKEGMFKENVGSETFDYFKDRNDENNKETA